MKKLAEGSEAVNIMVGSVDFIQEPLHVLVRLREAVTLSDLTEVAVPSRLEYNRPNRGCCSNQVRILYFRANRSFCSNQIWKKNIIFQT